jgi:WhiB family redox-sensing transcriptional regulator
VPPAAVIEVAGDASAGEPSLVVAASGSPTTRAPRLGTLAAPGDAWALYAKCADIPRATFFPDDSVGVKVAKRICASCPVRVQCLQYALANGIEHGVWGGASEQERRRMLRRLRSRRAGA